MVSKTLHYFIGGIGGSGMLPLAILLKGQGHQVSGSDRSYDQGRTPEKFHWLQSQGIKLHPQDGSGIDDTITAVVISKAVEDTVSDIVTAKAIGIPIKMRAHVLIDMFNQSGTRIAVSGTSGKTTTTGMIGFMLKEAGLDPSVMNGGIFRNYVAENPYSTAFVGNGNVFVSEVDESDGAEIVCAYAPDIAIIHNITLDHQPMEYLRSMFAGFLLKTKTAILNAADDGVMDIAQGFRGKTITYGTPHADLHAKNYIAHPNGCEVTVVSDAKDYALRLRLPGRHNVSNALAAMSVAKAMDLDLSKAAEILSRFEGIRRRMEVVGTKNNITVIDDFAHNPDKIAATIGTLKEFPGRLLIFFQPHGYGFLQVVREELAQTFAEYLEPEDRLYFIEPLYMGGTVDKSIGSSHIVADIITKGGHAQVMKDRESVKLKILQEAKAGDRIIVMGARDDTLSIFAKDILDHLM